MKKIIIYTDGASRGNPGKAAAGIIFCNEKNQIIRTQSEFLGDYLTNNEAEYMAVIFALKKFKALFGKELAKNSAIEIRSDSELLVSQLSGKYKVTDSKIQPLFLEVWNLKFDFLSVKFRLIPRTQNSKADKLANDVLDINQKKQTLI